MYRNIQFDKKKIAIFYWKLNKTYNYKRPTSYGPNAAWARRLLTPCSCRSKTGFQKLFSLVEMETDG